MKKLLSDESGYVLVLRQPQIFSGSRSAEKEIPSEAPVQAVGTTVEPPSCVIPHCCFYCAWCDHPILLSNDRIGAPFGNPDARKLDVRSIATVCPHCDHVSSFSMFRACHGYNTRHKIMHVPNRGNTLLFNWLHCEETTCTARVPLFINMEKDETPQTINTEKWIWDDLVCASGHRIRKVILDPSAPQPH